MEEILDNFLLLLMFEPETELVPAPDSYRAERRGQKSARDQRGDREVVAAVLENLSRCRNISAFCLNVAVQLSSLQ